MAYERLQALGEDQFSKVMNHLTRGESCRSVARMIQQLPPKGWGECEGVSERTLMMQLNRLRHDMLDGLFGKRTAARVKEGAISVPTVLKKLDGVSARTLDRLEELADWQRNRVLALIEQEKKSLLPQVMSGKMAPQEYRHILTQTNLVFNDYKQLLLDLQDVRFKMGLDEWKGPVSTTTVRGATQTIGLPDGTSVQKQVFEAVSMVEDIFKARKIPEVVVK